MPIDSIDCLTIEEQEAYDKTNRLIDKYIFHKDFKDEVIASLDELVELLLKGDLD